ncbi:tRNA epoxyqueuosine(34) reductase QueG [Oceanisphaera psychrotolerans]|uniref:Epoxyqueuosine reductase n=1 Tax=Oceanisphaera psychrotolerans TaxID=1414654 RepID=A0A1J4QIJ2_9GAMM|nr:tRNA epoxyqueuosine(34) reductase QueG [Oceanisphaera psychrotolerans]OIN13575.1 tRNA epoxyqueuosine(34) reductase QueG [Oceanisphaera psychrotolerans]
MTAPDFETLAHDIKLWAAELGFDQVGITDTDLAEQEPLLADWLDQGYHGEMDYMARHGMMRARPHELLPGTLRVISVRMNYLPEQAAIARVLSNAEQGYISRYALGRDYHKVLRQRLKKLADKIEQRASDLVARPFVDSAPVLERPLAAKAGLGWTGKHSLLLNRQQGSFFFLGELLVNLPLPIDQPVEEGCGKCVACITACPTGAIVAPYVVDARRCISYLTIELDGPIPEELRPLMGNRIYGCDDCQLICPWNRFANASQEPDFAARDNLHAPELLALFDWSEAHFLKQTEGSPIRRIGHRRWLRNIAVALGNAPASPAIIAALEQKREEADEMVQEHIDWALARQRAGLAQVDRKTERLIRAVDKGMPKHAR